MDARALVGASLLWVATAGAQTAATAPPPAQQAASAPTCSHCKERLLSVGALRQKLPAGWSLTLEREPVFNGEVLVVQAGQRNPQTVLLVHGLGQNGFTDWLSVMPALARRYHVLALDLPGFGYSASPLGKYSPRNYARVLQWLLARHAKGPALVVGHSMGGAAVLRLASTAPDVLSKLVLVDTAGILHRNAFVKHQASVPLTVESMPGLLKEPVARLKDFGNAVLDRVLGLPGDPTPLLRSSDLAWELLLRDRSNVNAALAMIDEDFSAAVYTLPHATHLIWGEADTVAPVRTGQVLARRLPRAQLMVLPGVGHTPMETASAEFRGLLDAALSTEPVPATPATLATPTEPSPATPSAGLPDLRCNGGVDRQYSGEYREVHIESCSAVRLVNLSAERVVIRNSIVQMQNVQVRGREVAVEISNSELIATASDFSGEIALRADISRLDLAGVTLLALDTAVEVKGPSRLTASICDVRSPAYNGHWHASGEYEGGRLWR